MDRLTVESYRITLFKYNKKVKRFVPSATFYIDVKDGIIIEAAPIATWTVGKTITYVLNYYRKKGADIKLIP